MTLDERLIRTVPTDRQFNYQQLEFYAFVHFSVNTYTDLEWGTGKEDPAIFNPTKMDAEQWVRTCVSAGMKGLILTCKHHDGFCLWQTKYTKHSVASSPYKNGKGDIVREVSDACRKYGLKFGVYLSPWDRNNPSYGLGLEYDDYFVAQLTELLSNYGEIFSVWFDGACGEGANGKKQVYDWARYYSVIRKLQTNACISVCGPDIRWCGNEAGKTRESEWSVVPARMARSEKVQKKSQQVDDAKFRRRGIKSSDRDLGSRDFMREEENFIWYPAEVNTSIRPGWFYHKKEDSWVKPLGMLKRIYNSSVGGNAMFLLNVPPTPEGLFHENDVKRLTELGDYIRHTFADNLLPSAKITADSSLPGFGIENVLTDSYDGFFRTSDGVVTAEITVDLFEEAEIGAVVLKENIRLSQRIERFTIEAEIDGVRTTVYSGTVVGYKKIVILDNVKTDKLYIIITDSRVAPTLSFVGVYRAK